MSQPVASKRRYGRIGNGCIRHGELHPQVEFVCVYAII